MLKNVIKSRLFTNVNMTEDTRNDVPLWYRAIYPGGANQGFYHRTETHSVVYIDRQSPQLVISFDNLAEAGGTHFNRDPWAVKFVQDNGWSHLGIMADGPTWFREAQLITYLEKLAADGFFDKFDRIATCGTSMGGFGAMTFANLVKATHVIAFSPQSSLDGQITPWENRFGKGRAQDWSLPYSDAVGSTDEAENVYVIYDHFDTGDKAHAERFTGSNVTHLRTMGIGHRSALILRRMNQLKPIMHSAISGTLDPADYHKRLRDRRSLYLTRTIIEHYLTQHGRAHLVQPYGQAFKKRRKILARNT